MGVGPAKTAHSKPLRVLVIEDEAIITLLLESMLADLGHEMIASAGRLDAALALAREAEVDLAILDVNLRGERSFPVAHVLTERGVPFLFATGYGTAGLDAPFKNSPTLKKPFDAKDLADALARILG
jgi:CheY-like chemotaxis protein